MISALVLLGLSAFLAFTALFLPAILEPLAIGYICIALLIPLNTIIHRHD